MAVPLKKRVKRALRSALLRLLVAGLGWLPPWVALRLGTLAGRLAFALARGERRVMDEQLALAFPGWTPEQRRAVARACLVHLGQLALETVTLRRIAPQLAAYVSFSPGSEELLREASARGRGVVVATGHLGHWELSAQRVAAVVQPAAAIARRSHMRWVDEAVGSLRAAGGVRTLWREDADTARRIIRLFRAGGSLGLLIDQDTRVQGVFVPFFGRPAHTPRAAADLALRFGAPLLCMASHRRGPSPGEGHEVELSEVRYDPAPADKEREVERMTAAVVALQEAAIRRHPAEWVWMHRRWKTRPASQPADQAAVSRPAGAPAGTAKSGELSGT